MRTRYLPFLGWMLIAALPVLAQEKLYPVRGNKESVILTADRAAFVVEKAFQHKVTLGFASDDQASFLPDTRAPIVTLWLTVQNASPRPFGVNLAQFTATDDQGRTF